MDCCQEVFAEAIERGRRTPVVDWGAFLRWLATRRAIDYLRRRDRRAVGAGDFNNAQGSGVPVETSAAFDELVEVVRAELARLPDQQAEAFWLACVEERSYEEIARHMGITRNAVGVLVHRARRHMRSTLNSLNPLRTE